jgi:hypothetical protein
MKTPCRRVFDTLVLASLLRLKAGAHEKFLKDHARRIWEAAWAVLVCSCADVAMQKVQHRLWPRVAKCEHGFGQTNSKNAQPLPFASFCLIAFAA